MRTIRLSCLVLTGLLSFAASPLAAAPPQSPIRLTLPNAPSDPPAPNLAFTYGAAATLSSVERTPAGEHRGIEAYLNTDTANTLAVDGKTYRLKRFHFHHASEHTLGGQAKPMEMHFVHHELNAQGQEFNPARVLVVGRWINVAAANTAPDPATAAMNTIIQPQANYNLGAQANFNLRSLVPAVGDLFHWQYDGSLTTGPTDGFGDILQGARWVFLQSELTMTQQRINDLSGLFPANARASYPVDNNLLFGHHLIWNIPAPGSATVLALAGLTAMRRRRKTPAAVA